MIVRYLDMSSQTGLSISEVEHIRQSVRDILITPIGSRVMRRKYGSLLSALIDQPQTPALRLLILAVCYSAIQKWCQRPRIRLRQDSNRFTGCDQKETPQMQGLFRYMINV